MSYNTYYALQRLEDLLTPTKDKPYSFELLLTPFGGKLEKKSSFSNERHHQSTYSVEEKHENLSGETQGVKFNVKTVQSALSKSRKMPTISKQGITRKIKLEASELYFSGHDALFAGGSQLEKIRIEVASKTPENLVIAGGNGFLLPCMKAVALHLPLALSPSRL